MAIPNITQNISAIPEAGHRGVDVQTVFVNKQEDFQDHLQGVTVGELNTLKSQINASASGMQTTVTQVNTLATNAANSATSAASSATSASNSASTATTKASEASASASQALTSKNAAASSATSASNSASTATTKASEASASATSASNSASTATTKASEASASASQALTSKNAAQTSLDTLNGILATLPDGSINDTVIGTDKAYSNQKSNELLNLKANSSHTHGNITNAGAIGTTASRPIITGTSGVLQAGSFGTTAGTFCQGNDARLATNLAVGTRTTTAVPVTSSTGTAVTLPAATTTLAGVMTSADKTKLDGIATGANNYTHPTTDGSLHVPATGTTNNGRVLMAGATAGAFTWDTLPNVTTTTAGYMLAADKVKLDGIAASANNYVLPTATATVKGGVELFSNTVQSVAASAVTATASRTYGIQLNSAGQAVVNVPWVDTDTTYAVATTSANGLMSSTDKTKLDGVAAGAQVNVATNLAITAGTTAGPIVTSSTGTNATLPTASTTASGVVTTSTQSWAGVKTFTSNPISSATQSTETNSLTRRDFVTGLDSANVKLTGNQTIAGVKTFSSSPTVPTPTAGDSSTKVATTAYVDGKMVLATAVATTSGTAFDFAGIPSWVKRISIMFDSVSVSGTDSYFVQLGTSSGVETSGYQATSTFPRDSSTTSGTTSTQGFVITSGNPGSSETGIMTINKINDTTWVSQHITNPSIAGTRVGSGRKTLASALTTVRITRSGTNTFDAGSINIMYEG